MDDPITTVSSAVSAQATIQGILGDLREVCKALPQMDPDRARISAHILDRLGVELAEAAGDLRKIR